MDDEDSQDELINKNISCGKGKRPSASILSDEEEDGDDSLEEGSDSGEEDSQDGEDEGVEEEDEEDESDPEDGVKEVGGAIGTEATDLGLSSDEDAEKCPICLNSFHEQPVATPQNCEHYFCLDCILEWAKNANSCPVDRKIFSNILLRKCYGGKVQKTITVQRPVTHVQEEQVNVDLEQTSCEVCGGTDREDRLLLCDGCDAGYHMDCLTPPLDAVPVEEWFCPECAPNSLNGAAELLSEEDSSLPTTSRSRPAGSRPMRAIARTQHSERVRANVNRHRITQARTAAQLAPQYLMRSTWLDETINAVVAGLNTAMYVRDLTPRPRARRRRKRAARKRKEGKDVKGKTCSTKVKRRKRKVRRKKASIKKKTTAQGRIAQSLGMKRPAHSSTVPSVYRPCEQTLGSMRADIGAASLSIYGDPFDLDPFDNGDEEFEQAPVQLSLLEAKRLSRSALRSHQPVARPILAGFSRRGPGIPQVEEMAEAAPVPDLLGSILSGQSLLLMDSSDVVINRDGSLKAVKPASSSSPWSSISENSALDRTPSTGAADFHFSREPAPSTSPLTNLSQTPLQSASSRITLSTTNPAVSHAHTPVLEHPRLTSPLPHRPTPTNSNGTGHSQLHSCSIRGHPSVGVASRAPGSLGERTSSTNAPAKKPTPKPVWVDVSVLPRIPKIKRENSSVAQGSRGNGSNNLPESSMTGLAGEKGRQNSVDQQRASESTQSRPVDGQRQRPDRAVPSPSFSNSFSTPSTSASLPSNSQTSSSSAISFRINSSGNPWQARRISVPSQGLPAKNKGVLKRDQKDKQMLSSSYLQAKKTSVKSEAYDPFNPTGSDASDSDDENEKNKIEMNSQVQNEDGEHEIKTESMDLDLPADSKMSVKKVQVKEEPASPKSDSWPSPSHQPTTLLGSQSESLATLVPYERSPLVSDAEDSGHSAGQLTKALDHFKSGVPSSHHSDKKVKIEVKSEPDHEASSVKSPLVFQITKGNGFIHELSSTSEGSDVNHKSKEKEKSSPCSSSEEEKKSLCASNSSPFKAFKQSDKQKKRSRSEEKRRSRSRSPHRRQSGSRSKEQSYIRDRKRSARSSSSESSRKRTKKQDSRDRYDCREKEGQKRSKKKRYSHSRSRSRSRSRSKSRERRRERTFSHMSSSRSRDRNEMRSQRKRSRSISRDRRRRENVLEGPHAHRPRQTDKSMESTSAEEKELTRSLEARNVNALLVKESKKGHNEWDATSIKKEAHSRSQEGPQLIDEPGRQIAEDVLSITVSHKLHESKPIELKEEDDSPISNIKESQLLKDQLPKQVKVEQIWPDEDSSSGGGGDDDEEEEEEDALVISFSPPGPAFSDCEKMDDFDSTSLPVVPKEEMDLEHLQAPVPVNPETPDSSDEEINVDYLIDNLDFIKKEMKDEPVANTEGAGEPQADLVKESTEVQQEMESVLVLAGTKAKSQSKRVTWNIQEPVVSQPDKMSKLALFKLKLKQDGSRKAASSSSMQIAGQVAAAVSSGSKSAATSVNSPALEGRSTSGQEKSKSCKGELIVNPDQKDMYMKKLHMQERAIEEVKLAIKPFYQKRDITKEEYKEILRKAVQKVCHSKSGEINPVKVANLVKAYVDKYKHARKHRKAEDQQHAEGPKASETPD